MPLLLLTGFTEPECVSCDLLSNSSAFIYLCKIFLSIGISSFPINRASIFSLVFKISSNVFTFVL
ncbi:hypothetical protein HanIR_Chr12g0565331 [Helianthus annuus]|nr:hypothetical protein HanIR_Chr12g0565331 [Helianthus annuus]